MGTGIEYVAGLYIPIPKYIRGKIKGLDIQRLK